MTSVREVAHPARRRQAAHRPVAAARSRRCCSGTAPAAASEARDLAALAAELPREGITVVRLEQPWRVAGKKVAPAPRSSTSAWWPSPTSCGPAPRWCSAAAAPVRAQRLPHRRTTSARPGCSRSSFPLHPPGQARASPGRHELLAVDVPMLVVQGERDPFGRPGGVPRPHLQVVGACPTPTTGSRCPARAALSQADALVMVVEATMEFVVREVVGNRPAARSRCTLTEGTRRGP